MICILAHRAAAALIRTDTKAWEAPEAVFNEELFIKNTFSHDLVSGNQLQGDLERWFDTSTVTSWGWIINRLSDNNNSERMSHTHTNTPPKPLRCLSCQARPPSPLCPLLLSVWWMQRTKTGGWDSSSGNTEVWEQRSPCAPGRMSAMCGGICWAASLWTNFGLSCPPSAPPPEVRLYPRPEPDRAKCSCSAFNLKLWLPPQI